MSCWANAECAGIQEAAGRKVAANPSRSERRPSVDFADKNRNTIEEYRKKKATRKQQ
jgi:hypothetical protein